MGVSTLHGFMEFQGIIIIIIVKIVSVAFS